ncbi:potassium transporter KtrB, partial [bacterium]|nr:potassium transporter KtrB [bacterium]
VVVETIGAFALSILFADAGVDNPLWQGTFHAVSAFCTAGFSLFDTSLEAFRDNVPINLTIGLLSTLGALGFIVVTDVVHVIQRKRERMTLTSRIILSAAGIILTVTTVLLYLEEPSMQNLEPGPRLLTAFFQAMTSMTTVGFDTHPMSALGMASVTLLLLVMVVGAGPSGTGGGLKTTTFSAMFGTMRAAIRGRNEVTFWKNSIPPHRVMSAAATVSYYITTLAVAMFVISLLEHIDFEDLLFEVVSALGTVGLSRGITADLSDAGKIVICAVMFMGRLGPLTVGLALFVKNDPAKLFRLRIEESEEDLAL